MGLDEISYVEIEISYVEILLLQIEYICKAYDMNNITHILNIFFLSLQISHRNPLCKIYTETMVATYIQLCSKFGSNPATNVTDTKEKNETRKCDAG